MPRMNPYLWAAAASIGLALATPAAIADAVLEVYDDSLTDFLAGSATPVQDVMPLVEQRGVNLDGSLRLPAALPVALAGNPFGEQWNGNAMLGNVRLDTGTFVIHDIDIALPAEGFSWVIGRSYNVRQHDGTDYRDSDGYQGKNWFQLSQPELVLFEHGSDDAKDVLYLVYGADRYVEFKRVNATSDEFKSKNGAAGVFEYEAGATDEPDTYTYYDQHGNRIVFFGFDADADPAEGQVWKMIDPDDNTAYVGDEDTGSTAIANGFDSAGRITDAYDSSGRHFDYTYTTERLTRVVVKDGSTEVARVDYDYYGDYQQTTDEIDLFGSPGDLRLVIVTTPLTDTGVESEERKYYRYYIAATGHPHTGEPHHLQFVFDFEGCRRFDLYGLGSVEQIETLAPPDYPEYMLDLAPQKHLDLQKHAAAYFDYDGDHRISEAWFQGACGCAGAGGADGTQLFTYESNDDFPQQPDPGYDEEWFGRTVVEMPGGAWRTQYFDEVGQPLHQVLSNGDPAVGATDEFWITKVARNSDGQVEKIHSPANVNEGSYDHDNDSTWAMPVHDSTGLITVLSRVDAGDLKGYLEHVKWQEGDTGSANLVSSLYYYDNDPATPDERARLTFDDTDVVRPLLKERWSYTVAGTAVKSEGATPDADDHVTSLAYTRYASSGTNVLALTLKDVDVTNPAVSTANNGSGNETTRSAYFRKDGTVAYREAEDGIFTYTEHTDGQVVKRIYDIDSGGSYAAADNPSNWSITLPSSGTGANRTTSYAYDDQGRLDELTSPDSRVLKSYYSRLEDERLVTLRYADFDEAAIPDEFFGPVGYSVVNQAGLVEVDATIALTDNDSTLAITSHIDETDDDPITAVDALGSLASLTAHDYSKSGTQRESTRAYFDIPATSPGTEGTHYDLAETGYNDFGFASDSTDFSGTTTSFEYDVLGRLTTRKVGAGAYTEVTVETIEYDSGADGGNSLVTKRTRFVEDSTTDKREITFTYDVRGNLLLQTNPEAPHVFNEFDNLGRITATALVTAGVNPSSETPTQTTLSERLALTETAYDELGRAWETIEWKVDQTDGSKDDSLTTEHWFDEAGRVIKTHGAALEKYTYDRLGRQTHFFLLADDNDTTYATIEGVSGDIVLTESQTVFESTDSDDVVMTVSIDRHHDDYGSGHTTGALDTNADGDALLVTAANLEGRVQITAHWYDVFGRRTSTVEYGTNGGANLDRDGLSVPARSDTKLRTDFTYNDDGRLELVEAPKEVASSPLATQYEYDALGRTVTMIENYVNGEPSSATGDDDAITRYEYTKGLLTRLWVDVYPKDTNGSPDTADQVTDYTYGVRTDDDPGPSEFNTDHLLRKITYPDNGEVLFAYNAQGELIYREDQAGNVVETDYDDAGRKTHERVTTVASGFDNAIERISTTYDALGRVDLVTQYDDPTAGTEQDQVKYTYDDWGNLDTFEQDRDSAITATPTNAYSVSYDYTKPTSGWRTVRRTDMTLPDGTNVDFIYSRTEGTDSIYDDAVSRVTKVRVNSVELARYWYNGLGQVVGTVHSEPDIMWEQYGTTSGSYPDLDRFNRVTSSRWTKDLTTDLDFYDVDVTYDRNSNVTLAEDNIHIHASGGDFDVSYTYDGRDRLTQAEQGTWGGSSITTTSHDQQWLDPQGGAALDELGNWDHVRLDVNGNGTFTDTNDYDDDRTHNEANELTARDTDDNGTDNHTLTYDANGNLTDDNEHYEYVYDAFGRLIEVRAESDSSLVSEYRYNGLGHRIGWHYDVDGQNGVTGDDPWYYFVYDEQWRIVAVFRDADTDPKEQFVNHAAGLNGFGGSSALDSVICRDKDANTAWSAESDGTLEERTYYCQNWRGDVSVLISDAGEMVEWVKYSAYGIPYGIPVGDTNSDGTVNTTDSTNILLWGGTSKPTGDTNLDGTINGTDQSKVSSQQGTTLGWWNISDVGNRKGYAGYEIDPNLADAIYHVRRRVLEADLGRWLTRDPLGYVDGANLYGYVSSNPMGAIDPMGTRPLPYAGKVNLTQCSDERGGEGGDGHRVLPLPVLIAPLPGSGSPWQPGQPANPPAGGAPAPPGGAGGGDPCGCKGKYPPYSRERRACERGCQQGQLKRACRFRCGRMYAPGSRLFKACVRGCQNGRDPSGTCRAQYRRCLQGCALRLAICITGISAQGVAGATAGGVLVSCSKSMTVKRIGRGIAVVILIETYFNLLDCGDRGLECHRHCKCMNDKCVGDKPAVWNCGGSGFPGPTPWPGPLPPTPVPGGYPPEF